MNMKPVQPAVATVNNFKAQNQTPESFYFLYFALNWSHPVGNTSDK